MRNLIVPWRESNRLCHFTQHVIGMTNIHSKAVGIEVAAHCSPSISVLLKVFSARQM
jgi:hypothetical protein